MCVNECSLNEFSIRLLLPRPSLPRHPISLCSTLNHDVSEAIVQDCCASIDLSNVFQGCLSMTLKRGFPYRT